MFIVFFIVFKVRFIFYLKISKFYKIVFKKVSLTIKIVMTVNTLIYCQATKIFFLEPR
jgi:hypothetical protein